MLSSNRRRRQSFPRPGRELQAAPAHRPLPSQPDRPRQARKQYGHQIVSDATSLFYILRADPNCPPTVPRPQLSTRMAHQRSTAIVPQMIDRDVGSLPLLVPPMEIAAMLADVNRLCMSVCCRVRCVTSLWQLDSSE